MPRKRTTPAPPEASDETAPAGQVRLNLPEGVYRQESSTDQALIDDEADDPLDDADEDADEPLFLLDAASADDLDPDKIEQAVLRELDAQVREFEAAADEDPLAPRRASGPPLWVGLDCEWWESAPGVNTILSAQLHVPRQPCFKTGGTDEERSKIDAAIDRLSRIVYAEGPAPEQRPRLRQALARLVVQAVEAGLIPDEPSTIVVVGFGLRFDLAALGDFDALKREVDSVAGKVATVHAEAELGLSWRAQAEEAAQQQASADHQRPQRPPDRVTTGEGYDRVTMRLRFIDVAAHVPIGTSLRQLGDLVGHEKLDIPAPYSISRMDKYLEADRAGFERYAMRDAQIAVLFALRLKSFIEDRLGLRGLPPTASGIALKLFLKPLDPQDRLKAFGLQKVQHEAWHQRNRKRQTITEIAPTPMRRIQEAFLVDCFAGGRNEAYWLGPTPLEAGPFTDYDLAGAYTTGLLDLRQIDFDHPRSSTDVNDYLGHVAGYALVDFEHPVHVRFPVFAVSTGSHGLVFPLKGTAYATAPEIQAAHDLGCRITIRWGLVYPWAGGPKKTDRIFYPFVKGVRVLRKQLKDEEKERAELAGEEPRDLLEEQFVKLIGNSLTGKCSQGLRPKNVYDTRGGRRVQLKPSPITNPAIAAHITGFIRAVLAEILNRLPPHRIVVSATTDGFLSNATEDEIDLSGPLCQRFQTLCDWVALDIKNERPKMLEIKHKVDQIVGMKTRGQLTGRPHGDGKIVLAKAGVQPDVDIERGMTPRQIRALQNAAMLKAYVERTPQSMVIVRSFPSLRDQWEKGIDLIKIESQIRMSLEYDMKRRLVEPRELPIALTGDVHLAAYSRPWGTVAEFEVARARMEAFRDGPRPKVPDGLHGDDAKAWLKAHPYLHGRCLKTLADYEALEATRQAGVARRQAAARGDAVMNKSGHGPAHDLARAFLRAYVREELGLEYCISQKAIAQWFVERGCPVTIQNVKDAKNQPLVLEQVPRTSEVLALMAELHQVFPLADLRPLLVPEGT